ncbi:MAG: prepilin-type N-terminal cleavage/methylation domain-containing protein [Patescibacteria group bacterium]
MSKNRILKGFTSRSEGRAQAESLHMSRATKKQNHSHGFTLIELLVVVAIIGILSSVVLASLSVARSRAADAAVKSSLSAGRAEAELYYGVNNNYDGVCLTTGANNINDNVKSAASAAGVATVTLDAAGTTSNAVCNDAVAGWAAQVRLRASTGVFCIDNTGLAVTSTTTVISSSVDISCL